MKFQKARYIFRLDDIHPAMDWDKFYRMKDIFDRYGVKPIIAVIPNNCDESLNKHAQNPDFWNIIKGLQVQGWTIAMHGYDHGYTSTSGGLLGINNYGEFPGLSYEEQTLKIKKGKDIFLSHGLPVKHFIAPAHSFDTITCRVLHEQGFEVISDGIALFPFKKYGLTWIPQMAWQPRTFFTGVVTFCFHTDTSPEKLFTQVESFLRKHHDHVASFEDVSSEKIHTSFIALLINFSIKVIFYTRMYLYRVYKLLRKKK